MRAYKAIYENLSEYDGYVIHGPNWYAFQQRFRTTLKEVLETRPKRVVDIGSGDGIYAIPFVSRSIEYVGADFVLRNLERLRERASSTSRSQIDLVRCDCLHLPFRKISDSVLCSETLEHLLDVDKAISELAAVVGGRVIITTPCTGGLFLDKFLDRVLQKGTARIKQEVRACGLYQGLVKLHEHGVAAHLNLFTPSILTRKISEHGFTVRKIVGAGFDIPIFTVEKRYRHQTWSKFLFALEDRLLKRFLLFQLPKLRLGNAHIIIVADGRERVFSGEENKDNRKNLPKAHVA